MPTATSSGVPRWLAEDLTARAIRSTSICAPVASVCGASSQYLPGPSRVSESAGRSSRASASSSLAVPSGGTPRPRVRDDAGARGRQARQAAPRTAIRPARGAPAGARSSQSRRRVPPRPTYVSDLDLRSRLARRIASRGRVPAMGGESTASSQAERGRPREFGRCRSGRLGLRWSQFVDEHSRGGRRLGLWRLPGRCEPAPPRTARRMSSLVRRATPGRSTGWLPVARMARPGRARRATAAPLSATDSTAGAPRPAASASSARPPPANLRPRQRDEDRRHLAELLGQLATCCPHGSLSSSLQRLPQRLAQRLGRSRRSGKTVGGTRVQRSSLTYPGYQQPRTRAFQLPHLPTDTRSDSIQHGAQPAQR